MIAKNYLYTIFFQMFSILVPIVTMPYITRILKPESIGEVNYSQSVVQIFVMLTMLGINKYGVKSIAQELKGTNNDIETFFENYLNQFILGFLAFSLYTGIGLINNKEALYYIQSIYILSAIFDINWFFQGKEDFKKSVTRGVFVKLVGLFLIYALVKTDEDIIRYALILCLSQLLGSLILYFYFLIENNIFQRIKEVTINKKRVLNNFLESLKVFVPIFSLQIGMQLYPIIIGYFGLKEEVAYFNNTLRIVLIPLYIITSLSTVLMPRVSKMVSINKNDIMLDELLKKSFNMMMLLAVPLTFGIIFIAPVFVTWFFGETFIGAIPYLQILAIKIIPMTIIEFIAYQYLIPSNKNTTYAILTFVGTAMGLILLPLFLNRFGLSSIVFTAPMTDFIIMILLISKSLNLMKKVISIDILKFILASIVTFAFLYTVRIDRVIPNLILVTIIEVVVFIFIYIVCLFIFRTKTLKMLLDGIFYKNVE